MAKGATAKGTSAKGTAKVQKPSKSSAKASAAPKASISVPTDLPFELPKGYKPIADLPKGYKPLEKDDYMCDEHLEYFRRKLLSWRAELLKESNETLGHLKEENWNEPDITDRATVETDTALELRTRDRYRKLINKIDAALRRIETREYGFCEETGDPIGLKRLEARPIATLSIAAQERHEREEKLYSDA
jgi:DnaK suppressor protein